MPTLPQATLPQGTDRSIARGGESKYAGVGCAALCATTSAPSYAALAPPIAVLAACGSMLHGLARKIRRWIVER